MINIFDFGQERVHETLSEIIVNIESGVQFTSVYLRYVLNRIDSVRINIFDLGRKGFMKLFRK